MAKATKKYRLKYGTHSVPNPEYKPDPEDPTVDTRDSHYNVEAGALVELNDDQYAAFQDKFEPAESAASDVKSAQTANLEAAKTQAAATGQAVNPNIAAAKK